MVIEAVCGCNVGKLRKNNEDNLFFNGRCLKQNNNGIKRPFSLKQPTYKDSVFAVFDGMGGEACGEVASFISASVADKYLRQSQKYLLSARELLNDMAEEINREIFKYSVENATGRMGSTMAAMLFRDRDFYACNVGDSRMFRMRKNSFLQISVDDLERLPKGSTAKPRLTQHLGMDPEEIALEPHIVKGELAKGDIYVICSDGVTDMVSNEEMYSVLYGNEDLKAAAEAIIALSLDHGGRDNITVILVKVK